MRVWVGVGGTSLEHQLELERGREGGWVISLEVEVRALSFRAALAMRVRRAHAWLGFFAGTGRAPRQEHGFTPSHSDSPTSSCSSANAHATPSYAASLLPRLVRSALRSAYTRRDAPLLRPSARLARPARTHEHGFTTCTQIAPRHRALHPSSRLLTQYPRRTTSAPVIRTTRAPLFGAYYLYARTHGHEHGLNLTWGYLSASSIKRFTTRTQIAPCHRLIVAIVVVDGR